MDILFDEGMTNEEFFHKRNEYRYHWIMIFLTVVAIERGSITTSRCGFEAFNRAHPNWLAIGLNRLK